ncbi:MAG: glucose PTS transporter subunit IIA [Lachnospiraceae bacterium]|nr:glucose PTS transporter subunit IIA [Lachnospiraceae bacterium]
MGKYHELAEYIVENVGGKENIADLFHCITRLRFTLKDEEKANDEAFKNHAGIVTLMKAGGYYQVVIGNHVPDVYADVCEVAGLANKDLGGGGSATAAGPDNRKFSEKALDMITSIFMPYLNLLCACGIIKGFNTIMNMLGVIPTSSTLGAVFAAIGDVIFYFLPVFVAYNLAVKLKMQKFTAMGIGLSLIYVPIYAAANGLEIGSLFGIDVSSIAYSSTVLPAIAAIVLAYYLEKLFTKIIPDVVKNFLVPFCVLMVVVPVTYAIIGPVANQISDLLASLLNTLLAISPIIGGAFAGFFWQIFVVFGVHQALTVPSMINLSAGTPDLFLSLIQTAPFAQGMIVLGMWIKSKNKERKQLMAPAWISGVFFGVTEPAIYGFTLPNPKFLILGCISSAIGSAYLGFTKTYLMQMGGLGIFAIPGFIDNTPGAANPMAGVINLLIAWAVTGAIAVIGTLVLYSDAGELKIDEEMATKKAVKIGGNKNDAKTEHVQDEEISAVVSGKAIALEEMKDPAFAALGKGAAIIPEGDSFTVVAPADGTLTTMFPTGHAFGLNTPSGAEVLVHIGIDTVELKGDGFKPLAAQGDFVKKGDRLIEVNAKAIKEKGYDITTAILVTNADDYADVIFAEGNVKAGDRVVQVIDK